MVIWDLRLGVLRRFVEGFFFVRSEVVQVEEGGRLGVC